METYELNIVVQLLRKEQGNINSGKIVFVV